MVVEGSDDMSQPVDTAYVEILPEFGRFAATLKRDLDKALLGLVGEFDRAFGAAEHEATRAGHAIGEEFQSGGESAERALRELDRTSGRAFGNVEHDATKAGGALAGLGGITSKIGFAAAGAAAVAGLGMVATAGLAAAASLEQSQIQFNSLLGSAKEGTKVFKDLQKFAAATPFEFTDLTGAAARFLAFNQAVGMTDAQLIPFLTTLGNIASVTSAGAFGMDRVSLALGQIASKGKVSLEEVNQVNEALVGFNGVAAIASATGMTSAEAMSAISAGGIDATTGVKALLKGMQDFQGAAGAMEAQSQTLLGVFSTFKDTLNQSLAGAFSPVVPALKASLAELTPILGEAVGILAPAIGGTLVTIVQNLAPLLIPLAKVIGIVVKAIYPLINILGVVLGPIIDALIPVFEALAPMFDELAVPTLQIVDALLPLVPVLAEILVAVIAVATPLVELIAIIATFLGKAAIVPLVEALAEVFGFLAEAVRQFGVWLGQIDWGGAADAAGGFFSGLWNTVKDFFFGIIGSILGFQNEALSAVGSAFGAIGGFFKKLGSDAISPFLKIFRFLASFGRGLRSFVEDVARSFTAPFVAIFKFFAELQMLAMVALKQFSDFLGISAVLDKVAGFFTSTGSTIGDFFGHIFDTLTGFGDKVGGVVGGFVAIITGVVASLNNLIGGFLGSVFGALTRFGNMIQEALGRFLSAEMGFMSDLVKQAAGLGSRILHALGDFASMLVNKGKDLIRGLWNGIIASGPWLADKISGFGKAYVLDPIKGALGIHSPSKLMADEVGKWIPPGIVEGAQDNAGPLTNMINGLIGGGDGGGAAAGGGGFNFGPGSIIIQFSGVVPTTSEAMGVGEAVGQGIARSISRSNTATAVRMM